MFYVNIFILLFILKNVFFLEIIIFLFRCIFQCIFTLNYLIIIIYYFDFLIIFANENIIK